jgi:hypothetical protein
MPKQKSNPYPKDKDVLVIDKETYLALLPLYQIVAQALQRTGKVKILYDDPKFKNIKIKKATCTHYGVKMQRLYKKENGKFIPVGWMCPDCGQIVKD